MAQKVQVLLVCDLHDNDTAGTQTVSFALDGAAYEIDVCDAHLAEMRDAFAGYVGAARRAGRSAAPKSVARRGRASTDKEQLQAMREWGRKNGFKASDRGRLSKDLVDAYHAAH